MTEVIPAILAKNFEELREKISRVVSISRFVQIDICDGVFVPSISWPMQPSDEESTSLILGEEEGLPYWGFFRF
jgi:pentose-5-phosphate-3-epimerase